MMECSARWCTRSLSKNLDLKRLSNIGFSEVSRAVGVMRKGKRQGALESILIVTQWQYVVRRLAYATTIWSVQRH